MPSYALITAAHNEEQHIEKTLRSVLSQTVLPGKWIVVSDGSTDRTDELVQKYAKEFDFVQLVRIERDQERNFASKVFAQNAGIRKLALKDFDFIGHLDADVSFAPDCFQALFEKFQGDPALGLSGGFIFEEVNGRFTSVAGNRTWSVAGAMQMFRRECYESIGGLLPLKYGCVDTYPEIAARMKGWRVKSFPELEVRHHRPIGSAVGVLRYRYRQGFADYAIGYYPVFEIARLLRHIPNRPFFLAAMAQLSGFVAASLRREKRDVSPELVVFLRSEQKARLFPFRRRCLN
jgi:poly-beta-1,6-N-acetyl-D-glucosamine synthase